MFSTVEKIVLALIVVCLFIIILTTPDNTQYEYMADKSLDLQEIRGLCISSGGFKGYSFIGAVQELVNLGLNLQNIKYYAGCSAGSIICGMLACDIPLQKILEYAKSGAMESAFKSRDYKTIAYHFENVINNTGITFKQLHSRGKYLICPVTKISAKYPFLSCKYYSPDTTPDVKISDAIALSSNVPLLLSKTIKETDGGMSDPYPIRKLQDYLPLDRIIGIRLDWDNELHNDSVWLKIRQKLSIANEPWSKRLFSNRLTQEEQSRTIIVKNNNMKTYIVEEEDVLTAYSEGVQSVIQFMNIFKKNN